MTPTKRRKRKAKREVRRTRQKVALAEVKAHLGISIAGVIDQALRGLI